VRETREIKIAKVKLFKRKAGLLERAKVKRFNRITKAIRLNAKKTIKPRRNSKTDKYIKKFLSTKNKYYLKANLWDALWDELNDLRGINYNEVAKLIKELNYNEFLKTVYWYTISHKVKSNNNNMCSKCTSKINLQVHHTTYKNHGYEIRHLKDLIVLCKKCHGDEHNIIVE
jgi:hypothetical protein